MTLRKIGDRDIRHYHFLKSTCDIGGYHKGPHLSPHPTGGPGPVCPPIMETEGVGVVKGERAYPGEDEVLLFYLLEACQIKAGSDKDKRGSGSAGPRGTEARTLPTGAGRAGAGADGKMTSEER